MESNGQHTIGSGFIESFDSRYPTRILETLLQDRTTGHNIIWADNEYEALGEGYMGDDEIIIEKITGLSSGVIKPRIAKEQEHQSKRTKSRAEVFTPSWLCNQMNNDIDATWFGVRDVFNIEDNQAWHTGQEPIIFPKKKGYGWHAYVESPRLEITCGEAPFVCSRYDTVTGETLPVNKRIGFLDRKLHVVSEKTKTRKEWVRWAFAALKASYGFEYQGDNLLLARINVFETFCEHLRERWGMGITDDEFDQAAWIVSWNFWQMNGFTCAVPTNKMDAVAQSTLFGYEEPVPEPLQPTLFDLQDESFFDEAVEEEEDELGETVPLCIIYDWQENEPLEFQTMKGKARPMNKKFYAVIGNPPYQQETEGNSHTALPIYDHFMDEAFKIGKKVELITPARFLFNAGRTPKDFNQRMLNDSHLKVEKYFPNGAEVFPGQEIKGGVAITYRDSDVNFGSIEIFVPFTEMKVVLDKVEPFLRSDGTLTSIAFVANKFNLDKASEDYPEMSDRERRMSSNVLKYDIFSISPNAEDDVAILGLERSKRVYKYISRKYVDETDSNLNGYKVVLPKAIGSGTFGETLSTLELEKPNQGYTHTFMSLGNFEFYEEGEALLKYLKTKFARAMLGLLKVTQDNTLDKWLKVPLQNFTSASDVDWFKSISEIDQQLYAKYGLNQEEIDFIESHVKEMN